MDIQEEKITGRSEARPRQRGGVVPAPPGLFHHGESNDGLATGLTASPVAELAIASTRKKTEGRDKREGSISPFHLSGGEESEEEIMMERTQSEEEWRERIFGPDFKRFGPPTRREWEFIKNQIDYMMKNEGVSIGDNMYHLIEDYTKAMYCDNNSRQEDIQLGMITAHTVKGVIEKLYDLYKGIEQKYRKLLERTEREKEVKEVGIQIDLSPSSKKKGKSVWTQTSDSQERRSRSDEILEEIEKRVRKLEEARDAAPRSTERPTVMGSDDNWNTVVGRRERRKKKESVQQREEEGPRQKQAADPKKTNEEVIRRRSGSKPLRALKRKMQQGAGVLLEFQGGSLADYGRIISECQKKINLEELGIPPHWHQKSQGGRDINGGPYGQRGRGKGQIIGWEDKGGGGFGGGGDGALPPPSN